MALQSVSPFPKMEILFDTSETPAGWMSSLSSSPPLDEETANSTRQCAICTAPSNGYHFNAPSCSACAAFFRRTVTLDRHFECPQNGNCRVNYAMRVICRACRYAKCIKSGMDRKAVQPRRDCNSGRRKISYMAQTSVAEKRARQSSQSSTSLDRLASAMEVSGLDVSPGAVCKSEYSSSGSVVDDPLGASPPCPPYARVMADLMKEERMQNERRRILYCERSVSTLLCTSEIDDIPYQVEDIRELTFQGIRRDIRALILVVYEWIRGWPSFQLFSMRDKKTFLRRCILYHTILDPAYLTLRLGYPNRFVMPNAMYVGILEEDNDGWGDEPGIISGSMKRMLYRPLLERVVKEIVIPMRDIDLSYTEFVILKALVSWKSGISGVSDLSTSARDLMATQVDGIFGGLHQHYMSLGYSQEQRAERTGNVVLLMSSVFAVGLDVLESHQKIQFFDLWELDTLLLQLLQKASAV